MHSLTLAAIDPAAILGSLKMAAIYILAFGFVFGLLAFAHEFGHFITAKMLGMSVDQFGIGFPPTYGWTIMRRSGTSYTLHPVPLGAFVKIRGMDPNEQDTPNSFMRQPPWARLIVLTAGSAANMVLAALIFILMGVTTGLPVREYVTNKVDEVTANSAAAGAGLKAGDIILAIRSADRPGQWVKPKAVLHSPDDATDMVELIHHSWSTQAINGKKQPVGMPLVLEVRHGEMIRTVTATPTYHEDKDLGGMAILGYRPGAATQYHRVGAIAAVGQGIDVARGKAVLLVTVLCSKVVELFERKSTLGEFGNGFGGPVQIASVSAQTVQAGWPDFLGFIGLLSINLAVLNLFPLPIFDGGNIILVLIEVVRRKQLDPNQFMAVQLVGLALIMTIFVYLTYHDILHLAHGGATP